LAGKPEGKRPLGKPRRRWVDNIKIDLQETGWDGMDWVDLAQVGTSGGLFEHGNKPSGSIKCWELLSSCRFGFSSRRAQHHK
jgi:hypothetical protein